MHDCNLSFLEWSRRHQHAFDVIQEIVVGHGCLMTLNYKDPSKTVFVTTDASNLCSRAVLVLGQYCPLGIHGKPSVLSPSRVKQSKALNWITLYNEKELLAIVCTLKKWCANLFCAQFVVFTDHKTLLNFDRQWGLSS
ncbi:hypothetical protein J132_10520 [Termitomyces sp. J132]|nr:hypothetical protein J132_10520 [Termitomyces sp. J132]